MQACVWTGWRSAMAIAVLGLLWATSSVNPTYAQDAPADPKPAEAAAAPAETTPPATPEAAPAAAPAPTTEEMISKLTIGADTMWVMVAGMLVFFMNLGFGCVEAGMCRAKNCVNILSKNFIVFAVTSIAYWFIGWGLMFGGDGGVAGADDYVGKTGLLMVSGTDNSPATGDAYKGDYGAINWTGVPLAAKFFFQLVFAGTAATIVSGAVAERIKYLSFIVFSFLMAMVMYPVTGHWVWGGGWLADKGFWDFAGCAVVHSVGGWAALTGIIILGPRIGKYGPDGKVNAIPGHSMMAAFIGCLVLWLGWFGFNPGSTMAIVGDPGLVAKIAINTNAAGAMATLTATATAWIVLGKPDIGMTLNGCLAGLVAITAPCAWVNMTDSLIIGAVAGVFVVFSVMFFDRMKCDDPVGATSVHLGCGTLGCLAIGLFAETPASALAPKAGLFHGGGTEQLINQVIGVVAVGIYTVVVSAICWLVIKFTIGLRVDAHEEIGGLDIGEHGNEAYHGFVLQAPSH